MHCAYGHGRSCTMLSACLTEAGIFPNFVAAFRHISELRPRVCVPPSNTKLLHCIVQTSKGLIPLAVTGPIEIEGACGCRYINSRQKPALIEWSKMRGDALPDNMDTTAAVQPPEATKAAVS